jgi:multiple sugar transport system substrate-binding protein
VSCQISEKSLKAVSVVFRIMGKIIYLMIVTFIIISVTTVTTALVQSEQFKTSSYYVLASPQQKENATITALVQRLGKEDMVQALLNDAVNKVRSNHSDLAISLKYIELHDLPPAETKDQMLRAITNGTNIDIISLDQIWLGEFAQKGLLTDLTNYTEKWGRSSEWYESNLDGGVYNDKIYGIWYETDVRGTWYWKDLLNQTNVDPDMLKTWDGYIAAAKKLNTVLRPQGIEGVHLTGASHSPDVWYPYLWMLGGAILESKPGHPTKDFYWYPSYNSSEGVKALEFIQDQVEAGVKPQKIPVGIGEMDREFANKKFAVMIEGSWMPGAWSNLTRQQVDNIGFIPMFPVPDNKTSTSTLMGGWQFSIPVTSLHKDIAWEIIENTLKPEVLSPWLAKQGFLPTQTTLGQGTGPYADHLRKSIPFYDDMISMIPDGRGRPNIPEYQSIAEHLRQALDEVYYGIKEPRQALDDAAAKSAKALGW